MTAPADRRPEEATVAPPPTEAKPTGWGLRTRRLLSSDWGLRALALVLAVLVWTVVRQEIEIPDRILVEVKPIPRSPDRFVAFSLTTERIPLSVAGPKGEIDEARATLGVPPTVLVYVDDLAEGEVEREVVVGWPRDQQRFSFRFPRRLVVAVPELEIKVFRRVEETARILAPRFVNVREGWEPRDVRIEPPTVTSWSPAGELGPELEPDPVDVKAEFDRGEAQTAPLTKELVFQGWRGLEDRALFRSGVRLPRVTVTVRFVAVKETPEPIENALWIAYAGSKDDSREDYEWKVDEGLPGLAGAGTDRFRGRFRGGVADLEALRQRRGEWAYGLVIPPEEMEDFRRSSEQEVKLNASLVWIPVTDSIRRELAVEFVPPPAHAKVSVTVRKKDSD